MQLYYYHHSHLPQASFVSVSPRFPPLFLLLLLAAVQLLLASTSLSYTDLS